MSDKNSGMNILRKNRPFLLFAIGQSVSSLGDTFQLIAATALLLKITGSGLSAGFGLICAPMPSILLSPFAGSLGDKFSGKQMLVILDLLRALVVLLFIGKCNIWAIYALLLTLSSLSVLYSPPSRKLVVNILDNNEVVTGNSLLCGISGAAYLIGPALAGVFIGIFGVNWAFVINSLSFIFSAFTILSIRMQPHMQKIMELKLQQIRKQKGSLKEGIRYFMKSTPIKEVVISCTIISFGAASMSIAFYPFAFDVLHVTTSMWGVMLSIFYGTNLIAMFILLTLKNQVNKVINALIYFLLLIISVIWFVYGTTESLLTVILLQAFEGVAAAVCGVLLWSQIQVLCKKSFVARVTGINDILNNSGRLLGIGFAYTILALSSPRVVFFINGIILMAFALLKLPKILIVGKKRFISFLDN